MSSTEKQLPAGAGPKPSRPTLRDHFAGLAMQALISHPSFGGGASVTVTAKAAYVVADAMLVAREGRKS